MTRLLLLTISLVFCTAVFAQTLPIDIPKYHTDSTYQKQLTELLKKKFGSGPVYAPGTRVFSLKSAPGVHRLPLDNMPCVVPDTKDIAAIPNVFRGKVSVPFTGHAPHIPNPATGDVRLGTRSPVQAPTINSKK